MRNSDLSIDPFARNCSIATFTNDLNPETNAIYHLDSVEFLKEMKRQGIRPDRVLFDPPYSPRQIKECYNGFGLEKIGAKEACRSCGWTAEKNLIAEIIKPGGIVLHFGWTSQGMGLGRGFSIIDILLVCHGAGRNDTICIAERNNGKQRKLF